MYHFIPEIIISVYLQWCLRSSFDKQTYYIFETDNHYKLCFVFAIYNVIYGITIKFGECLHKQ